MKGDQTPVPQGEDEEIASKSKSSQKKRRRKSGRSTTKQVVTDHDRYNEYVSMGAAYYSTVTKIVSMSCGYTVADHHAALDPAASEKRRFDALLERLRQHPVTDGGTQSIC